MSKKYLVKSMKYRIKFDKELYKVLDDITYYSSKIKNLATTMIYDWQQFSFSYNNRFGEYPKPKDILQTNVATDINRQIKEFPEFEFMNSTIRENSAKEAIDFFNRKLQLMYESRDTVIVRLLKTEKVSYSLCMRVK